MFEATALPRHRLLTRGRPSGQRTPAALQPEAEI